MDLSSLAAIGIAILIAYLVIKFVVSPLIKMIAGIAAILIIIYIIQHYLNYDLSKIFGPYIKYVDAAYWGLDTGKVKGFWDMISQNFSHILSFFSRT